VISAPAELPGLGHLDSPRPHTPAHRLVRAAQGVVTHGHDQRGLAGASDRTTVSQRV